LLIISQLMAVGNLSYLF